MGWGWEPHEGYPARRLADGTLSAGGTADFEAYVAVCSCGWRGGTYEPTEAGYEAAGEEWDAEHWQPLRTPSVDEVLVLRRNRFGDRHYLAGRPVHCGSALELLVQGSRWVPVRYETARGEPVAYVNLGGPGEAFGATDTVHFALPADAVLRWRR